MEGVDGKSEGHVVDDCGTPRVGHANGSDLAAASDVAAVEG